MKIGDRVILIKPISLNYRVFEVGHQFTITGSSGMRGWDLIDDEGSAIYETAMVSDHYVSISEDRDKKIDIILK